MTARAWLPAAFGATGVALGAFGAHALAGHVTPERLQTWETATRYHLLHAVVLLVLAVVPGVGPWPRRLIATGILLFAGSLYLLVLLDLPILGAVTPLGGISLIAGWISIAWALKPSAPGPSLEG